MILSCRMVQKKICFVILSLHAKFPRPFATTCDTSRDVLLRDVSQSLNQNEMVSHKILVAVRGIKIMASTSKLRNVQEVERDEQACGRLEHALMVNV